MLFQRAELAACFFLLCLCRLSLAGTFRANLFRNGPCDRDQFRCLNDQCISRILWCNGEKNCNDGSDEDYCNSIQSAKQCPSAYPFFLCNARYGYRCVPEIWKCDCIKDCQSDIDEKNCNFADDLLKCMAGIKNETVKWLWKQRKDHPTERWGPDVHRIAVALYLSGALYIPSAKAEREEILYEVYLQLLSKLAQRKLQDISSTELASIVNAFLVSCIDPRKFHVADLVAELRARVNSQNETNPYILLTLCNAGEKITEKDVEMLNDIFWKKHHRFWTDTQAFVVMALSCAAKQPAPNFHLNEMEDLTLELKKRQYRNGTVENLKTTALVLQALYASEENDDDENFDEQKALKQIVRNLRGDGSFGDLVTSYYVLPVLSYRSLVNISSDHCPKPPKDETKGLRDLMNQVGPKWHVQYSLWIGDERDAEWNLKLRVPVNTSFYRIMELAASIDFRYSFEYNMEEGKPYVFALSGMQDDPENGKYWFPYKVRYEKGEKKMTPIMKSPADVVPKDHEHLVMWYKCGDWFQ